VISACSLACFRSACSRPRLQQTGLNPKTQPQDWLASSPERDWRRGRLPEVPLEVQEEEEEEEEEGEYMEAEEKKEEKAEEKKEKKGKKEKRGALPATPPAVQLLEKQDRAFGALVQQESSVWRMSRSVQTPDEITGHPSLSLHCCSLCGLIRSERFRLAAHVMRQQCDSFRTLRQIWQRSRAPCRRWLAADPARLHYSFPFAVLQPAVSEIL
jgi:hypothetical protein